MKLTVYHVWYLVDLNLGEMNLDFEELSLGRDK